MSTDIDHLINQTGYTKKEIKEQSKFMSRKFFLSCAALFLNFTSLLIGKISGDNFVALALGVLAFYNAANVWQKLKVNSEAEK